MFTSKGQREDFQNDIAYEVSREERYDRHVRLRNDFDKQNLEPDEELLTAPKKEGNKMLTDEFFNKISDLTEKLHDVNKGALLKPVVVIEKKIEERKPMSQRRKYFNPGMLDRKTI